MVKEFLQDRIAVLESVCTWQEGIIKAAEKLREHQYINEAYIQAMINNIEKYGPYIVIIPQVAIPHSRPEEGALRTGISLLKLNEPVRFPEDKEVTLIIVLAANDSEAHLELIASLTDLFEDKVTMNRILQSKTALEIHQAFE